MGLIQRLIKSVLGFLLILALSGFIMTNAFYHATSEDFFMEQFKSLTGNQEQFNNSLADVHENMRLFFSMTNESETTIKIDDKDLTITREEAELSHEEFKDVILDKLLEGMYDINLREFGYDTDMSMRDLNNMIYSYMRLSVILAILVVIAAFVLLTGRFMFLGINLLIVGISYYPMKWSVSKSIELSLSELTTKQAEIMEPFITAVIDKIISLSSVWYLYFFIAGVVLVGLGILFKVMGWGMWFQSFFEKKKK
jgi:hypothetical protein